MTDPVILLGTQSNGETLPVQVDGFGRLVAEGLQGPKGDTGDQGPRGEEGPPGPPGPGMELPPDPYEGALLGWLNNELSWIGTPPQPIPEGIFGPIVSEDPTGFITVEGDIPSSIGQGVYIHQVDQQGITSVPEWNQLNEWITEAVLVDTKGGTAADLFSPDLTAGVRGQDQPLYINFPPGLANYGTSVSLLIENDQTIRFSINGGPEKTPDIKEPGYWWEVGILGSGSLESVMLRETRSGAGVNLRGIKLDDKIMIDPSYLLSLRINQVNGNQILGAPTYETPFTPGKYLRVPEQRVAPWVLYGNDPTSLIDPSRLW